MDKKFQINRIGLTVSLWKFDYETNPGIPAPVNTLTEEEGQEINAWVQESNLGSRIAWDMWRLRDEQAITLFTLKWGQ